MAYNFRKINHPAIEKTEYHIWEDGSAETHSIMVNAPAEASTLVHISEVEKAIDHQINENANSERPTDEVNLAALQALRDTLADSE